MSQELSKSVHSLSRREKELVPAAAKLKTLIEEAVYVQNAGNFVRLVWHIGRLISGLETTLHQLNQRKPYTALLRRSLAQEKSVKNGEGEAKGAKEFSEVSELFSIGLLGPLSKLLEIGTSIRPLKCENLKRNLGSSVSVLAQRIEAEFKAFYASSLEILNWPVAMAEAAEGTFNETSLNFFRTSLVMLVKLQESLRLAPIGDDGMIGEEESLFGNAKEGETLPSLWCVQGLVKPLEMRFNFNFRGKESTNRYDRPEWHFTWIRQLLKNHDKFLEFVTSLLHSMGLFAYDAKHEILRGLMPLVKEKLKADMSLVAYIGQQSSPGAGISSILASESGLAGSDDGSSRAKSSLAKLGSMVLGMGSSASILGNSTGSLGGGAIPNQWAPSNATRGGKLPLKGSSSNAPSSSSKSISEETVNAVLSHTINEILDFEKTLSDMYEYPRGKASEYPRPIDVLAQDEYHSVWLSLEVTTMRAHLRAALDASDAWERQYATIPESDDPSRVPRHCFVLFNVLSILQERYSLLGSGREEQMLPFLEAQMDILGDYLDELKDLQSSTLRGLEPLPYLKQCCVLYNAAWYARKSLEEWGSQSLYLELFMHHKGLTDPDQLHGSLFDSLIQQCKALCKHNLKLMGDKTLGIFANSFHKTYSRVNFLEEVKFHHHSIDKKYAEVQNPNGRSAKAPKDSIAGSSSKDSDGISKAKGPLSLATSSEISEATHDPTLKSLHRSSSQHGALQLQIDDESLLASMDVSSMLCDPLFLLREAFNKVEQTLNTKAFRKYWRLLASSTNDFLLDNLIFKKHFNIRGALQLKVDTSAIWLIWKAHTPVPQGFFKELHEAISILTLTPSAFTQLYSVANGIGRNPTPQQTAELESFGLFKLSPSQVRQVLDRRIDKNDPPRK